MSSSKLYASSYKKAHRLHTWGHSISSWNSMSEKLTCRIHMYIYECKHRANKVISVCQPTSFRKNALRLWCHKAGPVNEELVATVPEGPTLQPGPPTPCSPGPPLTLQLPRSKQCPLQLECFPSSPLKSSSSFESRAKFPLP